MTPLLFALVGLIAFQLIVIVWQRRQIKKLKKACLALAWDIAQLRWMFPDGSEEPGEGIH